MVASRPETASADAGVHRERSRTSRAWLGWRSSAIALLAAIPSASAVYVPFGNCLSPSYRAANQQGQSQLQFVPLFVDATYNATNGGHSMNVTVYGNVTGQSTVDPLPPGSDTAYWNDPNMTNGKIVNVSSDNIYTTLNVVYNVLSYTPRNSAYPLCDQIGGNTQCPVIPVFNGDASDSHTLRSFVNQQVFESSYAFSTFATTFNIISGDLSKKTLGCISANITPDLGDALSRALAWFPAAILILVGIATLTAARFSPWSSEDFFLWSSNYGRDEDLLRLLTPGFGDCLQYIQFIVLTGALSLSYPGFYQPVVSQGGWSVLMFNESFVSHNQTQTGLIDGIYVADAPLGMSRLAQIVGIAMPKDVWAGMAIWLACVIAALIAICQIGFLLRWLSRTISHIPEEDLRQKNLPLTIGNMIRLIFGYFLLPIVAFSCYQLVVAGQSPASVVAVSVIVLVAILLGTAWIARVIFAIRPREYLFDDLPTLLQYGPLYNTYKDPDAPYAIVILALTILRGIAVGGVQGSGIAQIILLAICEIILILTLHAVRPFPSRTSMNAYHTFFAAVRLATVLLSVAFVPSLGVGEGAKGWLGYAILLLHAIVLVFGFFLNSLQTLIEIAALAGKRGAEERRGGLARVFGVRQLSRRKRGSRGVRSSMGTMDTLVEENMQNGGRSRSLSQSSTILLKSNMDNRISAGYDSNLSADGYVTAPAVSPGPGALGSARTPSLIPMETPGRARANTGGKLSLQEPSDPYYRPPRRRTTLDGTEVLNAAQGQAPGNRTRESAGSSGDWSQPYKDSPTSPQGPFNDSGEGPSNGQQRGSVASASNAYMPSAYFRDEDYTSQPTADYAVRESDFYYGVRGPALSSNPSRRLKTGPANPEAPSVTMGGWFKKLVGGKTKEKGKGFEVVRSTRAPPMGMMMEEFEPTPSNEPYRDSPEMPKDVRTPDTEDDVDIGRDFDGVGVARTSSNKSHVSQYSKKSAQSVQSRRTKERDVESDAESTSSKYSDPFTNANRISDVPPTIDAPDTGGSFRFPSRINSRRSNHSHAPSWTPSFTPSLPVQRGTTPPPPPTSEVFSRPVTRPAPTIPRRSSRRSPSETSVPTFAQMQTVPGSPSSRMRSRSNTVNTNSPPVSPPLSRNVSRQSETQGNLDPSPTGSQRLPFSNSRTPATHSVASSIYPDDQVTPSFMGQPQYGVQGLVLQKPNTVNIAPRLSGERQPHQPFMHAPSNSLGQTGKPFAQEQRPVSTGEVPQRLTNDSVHPAFRDHWAGQEAEIVYGGGAFGGRSNASSQRSGTKSYISGEERLDRQRSREEEMGKQRSREDAGTGSERW